MKRTTILAALAAALLLPSCSKYSTPDPGFVNGDDICLIIEGRNVLTYDAETCQASVGNSLYRVTRDDRTAWYRLSCKEPVNAVGQSLKAELKWKEDDKVQTQKTSFKVQRIDGDQLRIARLWSQKDGIGISVIISAQ